MTGTFYWCQRNPLVLSARKVCFIDYTLRGGMRKPDCCLCENKDADQFHSNCKADQGLCFCYRDSTDIDFPFSLNLKFPALAGLCQSWLENSETGFLALWLICY